MFEIMRRVTMERSGMHTHYHNDYEIVFVMAGEALFTINGRQYRAGRGCILFISNLETHTLAIESTPYDRCYALISPEFFHTAVPDPVLASVFRNRPGHFSHMARLPESALPGVQELFEQMLREYEGKQEYWQEAVRSHLQLLLVALRREAGELFPLRSVNRTTGAILAIQRRLEERSAERFTLAEAAAQSFLEMHYLSRLFKEVTGFTFQQYQILQRIAHAKGLLLHTDGGVAEIGEASGFHNASHFIRIFRQTEGISPGQYRRMARGQS